MKAQEYNLQNYLNRIQSNIATKEDYLNVFHTLYENKNFTKLQNYAKKAIKSFPDEAIFYYWNALISYHLENYEDAFSNINKSIGIDEEHLDSILLAIDICYKLNEYNSIVNFINLGISHFPDNEKLLQKAEEFFINNKEYINKHLDIALKCYEAGATNLGPELVFPLYKNKNSSTTAIEVYVNNFKILKDDKTFLPFLFSQIIEKNIQDEIILDKLVKIIFENKIFEKGIIGYLADYFASKNRWNERLQLLYEMAVEQNVATYYVYKLLSEKYIIMQEQDPAALSIIFSYFMLESDNKDTIAYLLPFILKKKKFTDEEKHFLKIAYKYFPENSEIFETLIKNDLFTLEECIENLSVLENYFEQHPDDEDIIKILGKTYLALKREDSESLFIYEKFIRFEPENEELIRILSNYYLKENRKSKLAMIIYEKAYEKGIVNEQLLNILANYYVERQVLTDNNINIFIEIYSTLEEDEEFFQQFIDLFVKMFLKKKISLQKNITYFYILREALKRYEDKKLQVAFIELGYLFSDISDQSFEIYKRIYSNFRDNKKLEELLYKCYYKRNVIDPIGVDIFKKRYENLTLDEKKNVLLLLYQYYLENKIQDDFAKKILEEASKTFTKDDYLKNIDIRKKVKIFIKQNKKDKEALEIYYNYLQIDEENPTVIKFLVDILIKNKDYSEKYKKILYRANNIYSDWKEFNEYFALYLAKNKIRDKKSYEIWEKILMTENVPDEVMFELLSYYINNQIVNEKSEKVLRFSLAKNYKNKEILMLYFKTLAKNGNYDELKKIMNDLLKYDITDVDEIEFVVKTLLMFALFELLDAFLSKYEETPLIIYYKVKLYYYWEKLDEYTILLKKIERLQLKKEQYDIYELYADYYFYEKNDTQKGIWGYRKFLKEFPNDTLVLYKIASLYYYGLEDYQNALKYLKKLLMFNSNDVEALKLTGHIYMVLELYQEAIKIYRNIIKNGYKDSDILKNYAMSLYKTANYYAAIDIFKEYLKENYSDTEMMLNLAYTFIQIDFKEEAIETLENLLKMEPKNKEALYALFTIYYEDERSDYKAREIYEQLYKLEPTNIDAMKVLAIIYAKNDRNDNKAIKIYEESFKYGIETPEIVRILSNLFLKMSEYEDLDLTINVLLKAIEYFPSNEKYWNLLIELILQKSDYNEYKNIFEQAFKRKIKIIDVAKALAKIYFYNEDYEKALLYANNVLLGNPYDAEIYSMIADIYYEEDNLEEAKKNIEIAITYDPNNFKFHYLYAVIMEKIGNIPLAFLNLEKALSINNYHLPSVIKYVEIAINNNINIDEALEYLKKIKDIYPNNWEIPYYIGLISLKKDNIDVAKALTEESMEIEENETNVLQYADIILKNSNLDDAINFLLLKSQAIASDKIFTTLGEYYLKKNNIEKAKENLAKAVTLNPDSETIKLMLAKIKFEYDKDLPAAKAAFLNILTFSPNNKIAQLYLGRIFFATKDYKNALKHYEKCGDELELIDYENLLEINKSKKGEDYNVEDVFELSMKILQKDPQNIKALLELFKIYKDLNNLDKALEIFENIKVINRSVYLEKLELFFELLLDAGKFEMLRETLKDILKDPQYKQKYMEHYFYMEYFLFGTPYEKLKNHVVKMLENVPQHMENFKESRSFILFNLFLQEDDIINLYKYLSQFKNSKSELLNIYNGLYAYKKKDYKNANSKLSNYSSLWGNPHFEDFLHYIKDLIPLSNEKNIFELLNRILSYHFVQEDLDTYATIFIHKAESFFNEKFLKGNLNKAFISLIERIERAEAINKKKDKYLNKEIVLKFFMNYSFLKKDYKNCMALAKKYDIKGVLFNIEFYKELKKKNVSFKNLLKVFSESVEIKELPILYAFLKEKKLQIVAKVKILEEKIENLNEPLLNILWQLFEDGEVELEELEGKFKNSKSFLSRYYLFKGQYEKAYKIVQEMSYFEFTSPFNKPYILEILRKNDNYNLLLVAKDFYFDKALIDDDVMLYYTIALKKFYINHQASNILGKVNFNNITFLNALHDVVEENQYPTEATIEQFLSNPHITSWMFMELIDYMKDFNPQLLDKYSEQLEKVLEEEDLNILKGRILYNKAQFKEAKTYLKNSYYIVDFEAMINIGDDLEIRNSIENIVKYYKEQYKKIATYKSLLPFSYTSIFKINYYRNYLAYMERYYEKLRNLNELEEQITIANEILRLDPTKVQYYHELFYLYRDFKKDFESALRVIDRMIYYEPNNIKYVLEKAQLIMDMGELDIALSILLDIDKNKRTEELEEKIALIYEKKELLFDAINVYEKLFEKTKKITYLEKILRHYFDVELYDKIIKIDEKYPEAKSDFVYFYQGLVYFQKGNYKKSLEYLNKITKSDFERFDEIIIYKGLNYFNLKQLNEAQKYLKRALQRRVKEEIAWSKLAEILFENQKYDQAYQAIKKSIKEGINDSESFILAAEIFYAKKLKSEFVQMMKELNKKRLPETSEAHYRYGRLLYNMGKINKAEIELQHAIKLDENNIDAINMLIEIYLEQENYARTLPLLTKAFDNEPQKVAYYYAKVLYILDRFEEAKKILNNIKSESLEVNLLKGKVYFELESYAEAIAKFEKVLYDEPNNFEANLYMGKIYFETFKINEALTYLKKADAIQEDNPEVFKYLGLAYNKIGQTIDAIIFLKKSILIYSHDYETIIELGKLYYNSKRYKEAIKEFEKAIKFKYDLKEAHLLVAKSYRHLNQLEEALRAIDNAIEIASGDFLILEEKINILEEIGDYPEIIKILETLERKEQLDVKLNILKIKALRINGRLNMAWNLLQKLKYPESFAYNVLKERALILYQLKKYNEALPLLKNLYDEDNQDDEIFTILCYTLMELKQFKTLQNYIKRYDGALKETEIIPFLLGIIEYEYKNEEYAMNYFYQALAINREFLPAYRKLGEIYFKKNNFIMAIDIISNGLKYEKTKKMDLYYYLALSYLNSGKYYQALRYVKEALKWNYKDSSHLLIEIYAKLGLSAFGIISIRRLLLSEQIDTDYAWQMLITFLFNLNRKWDAVIEGFYNYFRIKDIEKIIYRLAYELFHYFKKPYATFTILKPMVENNISKIDNELISLIVESAGNIYDNQEIEDFIYKIEEAYEKTEDPNILQSFGIFYFFKNHLIRAKKYLEKALKINPQLDKAVYYLSIIK